MDTFPLQKSLDISPATRLELDMLLDNAVERLIPAAAAQEVGIAVIRREVGRYSVALSEDVPCGTTRQYWCSTRV
jgi:hypothetical protein